MKFKNSFLFVFAALSACIEPFDAKIPDGERAIVVDGMISDQSGPYKVIMYRSATLSNPYAKTEWIAGATITLSDDEGNTETLTEPTPGHYQTATTQGVIGKSYFIHIVTNAGTVYESEMEKIIPVGDFGNINYTFRQNLSFQDENQLKPKNGFDVFLDADLDPAQSGLTRWRWRGTFEIETHPELVTRVVPGAIPTFLPAPLPCSGYEVDLRDPKVINLVGTCTCCFCWATQFSDAPLLSNQRIVSNNKITNYNVAFIPANQRYFFRKFYLDIDQMSLSQSSYDFWKRIQGQQNTSSDLFQTPGAVTAGNVKLITEGGEPAIGMFSAHAIRTHSFVLYPEYLPYQSAGMDSVILSCMEVYPNSTNIQPSFW